MTELRQNMKNSLFAKNQVVSVRDPVQDPQQVLDYLARYTHRVAIANSRLTSLEDGMVTFTVKNRKKNRTESITMQDMMRQLTGIDITACRCCHRGKMLLDPLPSWQ